MKSREAEIISLLKKIVAQQNEFFKVFNNAEKNTQQTLFQSPEERQKYVDYVKRRLGCDNC